MSVLSKKYDFLNPVLHLYFAIFTGPDLTISAATYELCFVNVLLPRGMLSLACCDFTILPSVQWWWWDYSCQYRSLGLLASRQECVGAWPLTTHSTYFTCIQAAPYLTYTVSCFHECSRWPTLLHLYIFINFSVCVVFSGTVHLTFIDHTCIYLYLYWVMHIYDVGLPQCL